MSESLTNEPMWPLVVRWGVELRKPFDSVLSWLVDGDNEAIKPSGCSGWEMDRAEVGCWANDNGTPGELDTEVTGMGTDPTGLRCCGKPGETERINELACVGEYESGCEIEVIAVEADVVLVATSEPLLDGCEWWAAINSVPLPLSISPPPVDVGLGVENWRAYPWWLAGLSKHVLDPGVDGAIESDEPPFGKAAPLPVESFSWRSPRPLSWKAAEFVAVLPFDERLPPPPLLLWVRRHLAREFWNQTWSTRLVSPVLAANIFSCFASGFWWSAK